VKGEILGFISSLNFESYFGFQQVKDEEKVMGLMGIEEI